ncbi:MAG TPA: heat-inducible transcriptional repressor HrcA [Fibrobacteria bacterium]|nr:heat-inducible transcriptional repressor HrcA [Fibrobacteria bacterium]
MNNPLNRRQQQVLTAIVDHYIVKAEPVSSKILSVNPIFRASSATIRNTMAELENLGLVEQPHSSAGRLPTDRGYRTYIDELMHLEALTPSEKAAIEDELSSATDEHELMAHAARMLGRLTRLLGVAVSPALEKGRFRNLSLVPLAEGKVMLILTVSDMVFRTLLVDSALDTSIYRLESLARRINERMQGRPVSFLNILLGNSEENQGSEEEQKAFRFFRRSISKLFHGDNAQDIQISGQKDMFSQPDFEKIEDLSSILELLDSKITLVHFLRQRNEKEGVHVTVGEEHRDGRKLRSISIVTSAFTLGGAQGTVGVIGPKRMPYSKLISLVDFTAKTLSRKERPGSEVQD